MKLLPISKLGKWSAWLAGSMVFMVLFFFAMVNVFGQRGGQTFFSNPLLTIPMILAYICGTVAFIVGIKSIISAKERAILVFLSVLLGFFAFLYGTFAFVLPV